jgi:hypothetical protein
MVQKDSGKRRFSLYGCLLLLVMTINSNNNINTGIINEIMPGYTKTLVVF